MPKVVEVLLSLTLSLSWLHLLLAEWVVDNLEGFPITLLLKEHIHLLFGTVVAVAHDPFMELREPYILKLHFDVLWRLIFHHSLDVLNGNFTVHASSVLIFILGDISNRAVNEFTEVHTTWEIDKNILEKTNDIITGKAADTLKALELS